LSLVRRRIDQLKSRGVEDSHIHVTLNRCWQRGWDFEEVEKSLERPVSVALPYDETLLRKPPSDVSLIDRHSDLGKTLRSFARVLAGKQPSTPLLPGDAGGGGTLARFFGRAVTPHR
jgi:Flp pilus assembly CpaE family ATPase